MAARKLRRMLDADRRPRGWAHWCPACNQYHAIAVEQPQPDGGVWRFDGNLERPTFWPSIRVIDENNSTQCHYLITDGRIEFQSDCPHAMRGQVVELAEDTLSAVAAEENPVHTFKEYPKSMYRSESDHVVVESEEAEAATAEQGYVDGHEFWAEKAAGKKSDEPEAKTPKKKS